MNSAPNDKLSPRQIECLTLVAEGLSSKEIAKKVGLSPSTVDSHIGAAIDRIGAANRVEAARMVQIGLTNKDANLKVIETLSKTSDAKVETPFLAIPPLGGVENRLKKRQRILAILHIALVAMFLFAALVFSISGLVQLFVKS